MQQWEQLITSARTREQWGDIEPMAVKVTKRWLDWLGHVARMDEDRMPKLMLSGWLPQHYPQGGPWRRWRDVPRCDLKAIAMSDENWYDAALSRMSWRETYSAGLDGDRPIPQKQVQCLKCRRAFRREGDKARHKCTAEHQKPIYEQRVSAQPVSTGSEARVAWQCTDVTSHCTRPDRESSSRRRNRPSTQLQTSQPLKPVQCQQ